MTEQSEAVTEERQHKATTEPIPVQQRADGTLQQNHLQAVANKVGGTFFTVIAMQKRDYQTDSSLNVTAAVILEDGQGCVRVRVCVCVCVCVCV